MMKAVLPATLAMSMAFTMQPAYAQGAAAADKGETLITIRPAHLVAIGVGVLGGIVVGEVLLGTDVGLLVGGGLGGYLGHVWYGGRQIELALAPAPKS
jgi:hypothetical protein